jgi:hypothetical protein
VPEELQNYVGLYRLRKNSWSVFQKSALCQGTTSVVPQNADNKGRALAPDGYFSGVRIKSRPFSAACLAPAILVFSYLQFQSG